MELSTEQLDKLADLSLSLAKGLFLAALAAPVFSHLSAIFAFKTGALGVAFTLVTLKLIEIKGVLR